MHQFVSRRPIFVDSGRFKVSHSVPESPCTFDGRGVMPDEDLHSLLRFNAERDKDIPFPNKTR